MRRLLFFAGVLVAAGVFGAATQSGSVVSDWDLLRKIVLVPGISGQERKLSDFVQGALPSSLKAQRDAKGDVWFTVGDGRPYIFFVAHMDELGFVVDKITPQGMVQLKPGGGLLPQACEARPFVIHTAKGPVEGIIQPRPDYYRSPGAAAGRGAVRTGPPGGPTTTASSGNQNPSGSQPQATVAAEILEVYLGVSTEAEARALGVAEGNPVIFKKRIVDLTPDIMAARAVDDRAGCAAVLAAALRIDWAKIRAKKVTFAWSVQEETGLFGAQELAKALKPDYVFAVDTFVSTDSPLENKRFGDAVLGKGAVLRSIDTSNVTPKADINKVAAIAEARGIPIQIRNSRGGNDGSVFVVEGAADIPLSWAGVYAHSFIEKIVRSDLEGLTALIQAIVEEWK